MFLRFCTISLILLILPAIGNPGEWFSFSSSHTSTDDVYLEAVENFYKDLQEKDLNKEAFYIGMLGFRSLCSKGLVLKDSLITIIDYSLPSSQNRFFVIDLHHPKVLYKTLVAHGRNSGELYARSFSNKMQSYQTALGFYLTGSTYHGNQGYSMLLTGVDTGYNDLARRRSIVVHGAPYATKQFLEQYGRLGRSLGCPALPPHLNDAVISLIKEGSVLFSYYPDEVYLNGSPLVSVCRHRGSKGTF
jgi:hypothetical protein